AALHLVRPCQGRTLLQTGGGFPRQVKGKGFEIELEGDIAAMVELGLESKKPAPGGAGLLGVYRSSVKVVAGAGNQRYLHFDWAPLNATLLSE
ncbi:hypothetical protein CU669_20940, partial [Paramagnetospirillum kuznetsovii]